jgi:hypothetical protein
MSWQQSRPIQWQTHLGKATRHPTNQCTRIAMLRLIRIGWGCKVVFVLKVALPARNRVISSVGCSYRFFILPLVHICANISV